MMVQKCSVVHLPPALCRLMPTLCQSLVAVVLLQLLLFLRTSITGQLRPALLDILATAGGSSGAAAGGASSLAASAVSADELAAQLDAAITAARAQMAGSGSGTVDGAIAMGDLAGKLVKIVVGVSALQLVKGLSETVLEQVRCCWHAAVCPAVVLASLLVTHTRRRCRAVMLGWPVRAECCGRHAGPDGAAAGDGPAAHGCAGAVLR